MMRVSRPAARPSLLWVTPTAATSAIGRFSALVTREIASIGYDVTVASSDIVMPHKKDRHEFGALKVKDILECKVDSYDYILYNIGNNFKFHGKIIDIINDNPGISIFHDVYLYDLFYGYLEYSGTLARHEDIVRTLYGKDTPLHPSAPLNSSAILEHRFQHFPMLKWLAPRTLGAVSHARFGLAELEPLCSGPVTHIPLAYTIEQWRNAKRKKLPATRGKLRLTTFGDINPNKRVEPVIRAIGADTSLATRLIYSLVGRITKSERSRLTKLAQELGVSLEIVGEADDSTYASYLLGTDIVSCLRFPTTESASATTIEAMLAGKPVLVTDIGFYRDIPGDLAIKINPATEGAELTARLSELCATPAMLAGMGTAAAEWAKTTFCPIAYANKISSFLSEVSDFQPMTELAFTLAQTAQMLNMGTDDNHLHKWTRRADALFNLSEAGD